MTQAHVARLEIDIPERLLPLMRLLLSFGICCEAQNGASVNGFLQEALGVDADYIENRVQTLFVDGRAVDAPDETRIHEPCTIALSAAMPGLFGAAFRKQGVFRALRRQYDENHGPADNPASGRKIPVTVKCFNQVAADLGEGLLARGVSMRIWDFGKFWKRQQFVVEKQSRQVRINGEPTGPGQGPEKILQAGNGCLQLRVKVFS